MSNLNCVNLLIFLNDRELDVILKIKRRRLTNFGHTGRSLSTLRLWVVRV